MTISDDAMLAELMRLMRENETPAEGDPGLPSSEIKRIIGKGDVATRRMIKDCLARGTLVMGRRYARAIDGTYRWQPVYRPVADVEVRTK